MQEPAYYTLNYHIEHYNNNINMYGKLQEKLIRQKYDTLMTKYNTMQLTVL